MLTRDTVLTGPPEEVTAWATGVGASFARATGRDVATWRSLVGGTVGHHTWSMMVDGTAEMVELVAAASADDDYRRMAEDGRAYITGPIVDTMYTPYGGTLLDPDAGSPGNVAIVTRATSKSGSLGHAVGWGLEAAEYVSRLTAIPVTVFGQVAGRFSTLTWIGVAEDAAQADEYEALTRTDDEYLKLIARGGGFFADESARTQLFLRIG